MIERQEFWQWHDVVVQTRNNKLPARIPVITNSTSLELLGTVVSLDVVENVYTPGKIIIK